MTPIRTPVSAAGAPDGLGPFSQAIQYGETLYLSGTIAYEASNESVLTGGPAIETTRCLENLDAVCQAAGVGLATHGLRLKIYTTRIDLFAEINEAYATFFADAPPARTTVGVSKLAYGASVEIDAIVAAPSRSA